MTSINNLILRIAMLCFLIFFASCGSSQKKIRNQNYEDLKDQREIVSQSTDTSIKESVQELSNSKSKLSVEGDSLLKHYQNEPDPNRRPYYHLSKNSIDNNVYYNDTVTARTSEELIAQIKSNRLIKLLDKEYILSPQSYHQENASNEKEKQGLFIDSIKNLKIIGTGSSKLLSDGRNTTVVKISNAHNIHLDSIIIGQTEDQKSNYAQNVLKIDYSYNIDISNSKLVAGFLGLVTYAVYNLKFSNSEIMESTGLIFDLERSRKFEFYQSKFYNNNLTISVLGAFTNSTKEISFSNCVFLDNKPKVAGNPAFNFNDNYNNFNEPILFENCTFKNNKGYKWYEEKIKLNHCAIDSSDFIGLQRNH